MALTPDWDNKVLDSSASITDLVAFHKALRELEASLTGMLYPAIHTFRAVSLGGNGYFYAVDFVNGWKLRFPTPGNYEVVGNLNVTVVPTAGVFLTLTKALAFAVSVVDSSGGSTGTSLTKQDVRDAMTLPASTPAQPGSLDQAIENVGDLVVALS